MNINKEMNNSCIVVGIDLGTTNSCCAIWKNKKIEIIPDKDKKLIPSLVYLDKDKTYVGYDALKNCIKPAYLHNNVKRLIGRKMNDPYVNKFKNYLQYKLKNDSKNNILIKTYNKYRSPEEISSIILSKIKILTNIYLKSNNNKINAVVTIPAYFNDSQRQATKDACEIAGINCIRMINEPTAAALSYGILGKKSDNEKNIIVYDLGGGTLDVSLLNIDEGIFEVLATTGDSYLGGEDFTKEIYNFVVQEFKKENEISNSDKISIHQLKLKELKDECELAKIRLSSIDETLISVERFWGTINLNFNLTRNKFQEISKKLLDRIMEPVINIMKINTHDIKIKDITDVLLVGGATQMPIIQFMLHNYFGIKPSTSNNPDYIVASGAAIQGYLLTNNDNPFSNEIVLVDIIPLSLGIELSNGIFSPIIERNSTIPIKKTKKYTTDTDNETSIEIKIYEGERDLVKDNHKIGNLFLKNIEQGLKGVPIIEVTFTVDVNGIINISAKDIRTKSTKDLTILNDKERLSKKEIDLLIKEAEYFQKTDYERRVNIEKKNELKEICKTIINNLNNDDIKIPNNDKKIIYDEIKNILNNMNSLNNQVLLKKINFIKKKYISLILDYSKTNDLESYDATNITYSDLNNDKISNVNVSIIDDEINDIEILRNEFIDYINSISDELSYIKNHKFKHYIENLILWINTDNKIELKSLKKKYKELKEEYTEFKQTNYKHDYKNELIILCNVLLDEINTNNIALSKDYSLILSNFLKENLNWIKLYEGNNDDHNYRNKIDEINLKCQDFYNKCN